ncbi:hypothetical protein C8F04DRAFT_1253135 [Mycena alexandri]|uniref:Uncharacterized protein n=1 Tax=Mycena alexandri TaxID=1745969 RepID=A0AAD6T8Q0_9AGAR|nr:hypothetical protein C8F04DRAFT_1253135 [Mycena alexandri]
MAKRAAATSEKALAIAAIATAEALEDSQVIKKSRGRPKGSGKKKKQEEPEPIQATVPKDEPPATTAAADIDDIEWTAELTWTLVTGIQDGDDIREGLFPGVGVKSSKLLKTKPKTHWQYELAKTCFEDHPQYKDAFAAATTTAQKGLWTTKIKNRIAVLVTRAKANITAMGETGAGVGSADEIYSGTALANKWDEIQAESPWFFHLGLGNNDTDVETSILLPTNDTGDDMSSTFDDTQSDFSDSSEDDLPHAPAATSDDELPPAPTLASVKRKHSEDEDDTKPSRTTSAAAPAKKRTKPRPSMSAPAATAPAPTAPAKKSTNAKDRFNATVLPEEETAQKLLGLKQEKLKGQKEVQLARIRAETELRLARDSVKAESRKAEREAKAELVRLKFQQEHEFCIAQLQAHAGPSSMSFSESATSSSSRNDSPFGFFDGMPALPGPSNDSDLYKHF